MKRYKGMIVGFVAGCIAMTTISVFADDGLEKVEAYLRKGLPITLDGNKLTLENPPLMYDGSTYLKLRDVAKTFNVAVNWNEETQTVELGKTSKTSGGPTEINGGATITDLSQLIPILRKDHDVSFNRNELVFIWNMTDEEYNAYNQISDRNIRRSFCIRIFQYSAGVTDISQLTGNDISQLIMRVIYNSEVIASFADKAIDDPLSFIEY
jgi:hypothetical protein